jgi:transporter family-2 protein
LAIAGQIISSLLIDHFGLMGATERPVSMIKLAGTLVMLLGLAVTLFSDKLSGYFSS